MNIVLIYLLKASITLADLYLVFWLFLRKDTFHQLKRFILLANLLISLTVPLLPVPSFKMSWDTTGLFVQPVPVIPVHSGLLSGLPPATSFPDYAETCIYAIGFIYLAGVLIMLAKFSIELFSLYNIIRKAKVISRDSVIVAVSDKVDSPFSFFSYLMLSPEQHQPEILSHILAHEQVHISGKHTLDRLLSEVYTIFFWFNPFAWRHLRLLVLNLEYMADRAVLEAGVSTESYQRNLLKLALPDHKFRLTNPFNQSNLLKRIHMMNQPSSPALFRLKTALIFPVLTGLLAFFNGTQAEKAETTLQAIIQPEQSFTSTEVIQVQTRTITGIIQDADTDKPLPGVHIRVKGQPTSTLSDASGKFSIATGKNDKVLLFELPGYNTTEMAITAQNEMIVLLSLAEGPAFTSSYTYLSADTVRINVKDITDFPGENTKITGRNIEIRDSTILSDDSILYLIDGKKADKALVKKLEVEKIASITVYKDQLSLRKYGADDKKGVVAIELKK